MISCLCDAGKDVSEDSIKSEALEGYNRLDVKREAYVKLTLWNVQVKIPQPRPFLYSPQCFLIFGPLLSLFCPEMVPSIKESVV